MDKVLVIKGNWQENRFMIEFVNLLARHGISYHCVVNDDKSETVLYVKKEGFNAHKLEVRDTLKETMNLFKFIDGKLNAPNIANRSKVITSQKSIKTPTKSTLQYLNFVSFQLTYRCSYNCVHCFQKNLKKQPLVELSTEEVKTAIFDLHKSGFLALCINFVGGEILGNRGDILEILEYTQSIGFTSRLNTNSWWANEANFSIGKQCFSTARDFVYHIKSLGLGLFAFSCDLRLLSSKNMENLISSIKLCEDAAMAYQLIFTGMDTNDIKTLISSLTNDCGKLNYMIPAVMEMVDIGGGAKIDKEVFCRQSNKSYCNKKGFYRPTKLYVSPDGKVRTCMYAIGLNNCGSLREMNMLDIVKNFPNNSINEIFSDPIKYERAEKELFLPYMHHYHPIIHECTRYAIIARVAEMTAKYPEMDLNEIHQIIAQSISGNE